MLIQFKVVKDDSCWMIDTQGMRWTRNEGDSESSKILELGKLVPVGIQGPFRVFALEGRDEKTEGPGAGLCTFGYFMHDIDTTLVIYVNANVEIKDFISRRPIDAIRYQPINGLGDLNEKQEHQTPLATQES